jgi:nucleotide-binding universal stress UspA family protein
VNKIKTSIRELAAKFEEMMTSVAFAEAGEVAGAIKILRERYKVLLVLTGEETDLKAAKYALNMCKRIGAGLEVLYVTENEDEMPSLEECLKELKTKGIEYQILKCKEPMKEEIIRFTEKEKGIRFVVIDSEDLGIDSEDEKTETLKKWERLNCPLILVSGLSKT